MIRAGIGWRVERDESVIEDAVALAGKLSDLATEAGSGWTPDASNGPSSIRWSIRRSGAANDHAEVEVTHRDPINLATNVEIRMEDRENLLALLIECDEEVVADVQDDPTAIVLFAERALRSASAPDVSTRRLVRTPIRHAPNDMAVLKDVVPHAVAAGIDPTKETFVVRRIGSPLCSSRDTFSQRDREIRIDRPDTDDSGFVRLSKNFGGVMRLTPAIETIDLVNLDPMEVIRICLEARTKEEPE